MAFLRLSTNLVTRCGKGSPLVAVPLLWRGSVCLISRQHTVNERYLTNKVESDRPVPFLSSRARNFKVDDAYRVDPATRRKQRYAIPLGFGLFGVIMYLGFFRTYGEADSSVMDYLTRDVSSKLPEGARQRMPVDLVERQGVTEDPKLNGLDKK